MRQLSVIAAFFSILATPSCATTSHATVTTQLGVPVSAETLIERAALPGPVTLNRITGATWEVDRSGLLNLEHPRAQAAGLDDGAEPIVIQFFELNHPTRGLYLVDTGIARGFRHPDSAPVSWLVKSAMHFDSLSIKHDASTWRRGNHEPLRGVFLTHLHLDHILGLPDLDKAVPLYVGPGEASASNFLNTFVQGTTNGLLDGFGALRTLNFRARENNGLSILDLFGDHTTFAIHVPGHTPGSLAFLVRTPEGPQLIAGDACHTEWGWRNGVEPGNFSDDLPRSATSLASLRSLASKIRGLKVHPGHQHL